jgi:ureidoacrylate peracid hydrolase
VRCRPAPAHPTEPATYFFASLRQTVQPNVNRRQAACRRRRIEILYSVIEIITRDGRDRSLDYKISGIELQGTSRCVATSRPRDGRNRSASR